MCTFVCWSAVCGPVCVGVSEPCEDDLVPRNVQTVTSSHFLQPGARSVQPCLECVARATNIFSQDFKCPKINCATGHSPLSFRWWITKVNPKLRAICIFVWLSRRCEDCDDDDGALLAHYFSLKTPDVIISFWDVTSTLIKTNTL